MHQFGFIRRCHDDHVRQAGEIGDIECAAMGLPVSADIPGAIHGKPNRQVLECDVMHDLIERALQEGRINRRERLHPVGGKPGGKRHRVLFGKTDIECTVGELLFEHIDACAGRHRRGDRDDLVVVARFLDQGFGINLGVARRIGLALVECAGDDIELADTVILVAGLLGRLVAFALLRHDMDQHGPFGLVVTHIFKDRNQMFHVVAVDRADIEEAELFEQRAAGQHTAGIFLGPLRRLFHRAREFFRHMQADIAQRPVGFR